MTLPSWLSKVRLPSFSRVSQVGFRLQSTMLVGVALFLLGLFAGIYLFFPTHVLQQRLVQEVESQTGATVEIGQLGLYPVLTVAAERLEIGGAGLPGPIKLDTLTVSPQWLSLLSGDPGIQLNSGLMGGVLSASLQRSGRMHAKATGLHLEIPMQTPVDMLITGVLDTATFTGSVPLGSDTATTLSLKLTDVKLAGLESFAAGGMTLPLGAIELQVRGEGRMMKVVSLTAKGGALEASGKGTLLVGKTAASCRIDLELQVRPGTSLDTSIATLLELVAKPNANGDYLLRLKGPLTSPALQPGG